MKMWFNSYLGHALHVQRLLLALKVIWLIVWGIRKEWRGRCIFCHPLQKKTHVSPQNTSPPLALCPSAPMQVPHVSAPWLHIQEVV